MIFSYVCSKHRLWVHVRTVSRSITSTHDLCFRIKDREKPNTPVNPCFTIYKWDVRGINHTDMFS